MRGLWALLAVWLLGATASAAQLSARTLVTQSAELLKKGRYAEAAVLLEKAQTLDPSPRIVFNLARTYERGQALETAVELYENYQRLESDDVTAQRRAREALDSLEPAIAARRPPTASTELDETGAYPGTSSLQNGVRFLEDYLARDPLPAGRARATAALEKLNENLRLRTELLVAARAKAMAPQTDAPLAAAPSPVLEPVVVAPSPALSVTSTRSRPLRTVGIVTLAGGVAALAVALGFGVWANSTAGAMRASTDPMQKPLLRAQTEQRAQLADVLYGSGGALAGLGLSMLIIGQVTDR